VHDCPCDRELQSDKNDEADDRLRDADVFRKDPVREHGAQRDGHDQVEGVPFCQRALPGDAQQDDERQVSCACADRGAKDRIPAGEEDLLHAPLPYC
jgi:hypothetical protein